MKKYLCAITRMLVIHLVLMLQHEGGHALAGLITPGVDYLGVTFINSHFGVVFLYTATHTPFIYNLFILLIAPILLQVLVIKAFNWHKAWYGWMLFMHRYDFLAILMLM